MRTAEYTRTTKETNITAQVQLDGTGRYNIETPIGFLNHMLEQLARHSMMDLTLRGDGDTHIDFHHLTEDSGYTIGEVIKKALGDKMGINRYGFASIPMDETLTQVSVDLSNRPYLVWNMAFSVDKLGDFDTELFKEWFQAFANALGANIHIHNMYGVNNHHKIESAFKGLARALRQAMAIDAAHKEQLPTTKGAL